MWVQDEKLSRNVESTEHPVEKGEPLTDHVKPNPAVINITGAVVGESAAEKLSRLYALMNKGALITYTGRNVLKNAQIKSFNTTHSNTVWGGYEFDMEIKQVRIAKPAYQSNSFTASRKSTGMTQIQKNAQKGLPIIHTVKKGDTCWNIAQQYNTNVKEINKHNNILNLTTNGAWTTLKIGVNLVVGYR